MIDGGLYFDRSMIDADALEQIVLGLVLSTNPVYVNCRFGASSPEMLAKLAALAEARLIRPWSYPYEPDRSKLAEWVVPGDLLVMSEEAYRIYAEAVKQAVVDYQQRVGPATQSERITELVTLANELWGTCIAAYLGTDRVLAAKYRAPEMIERTRRANYELRIAGRLLEVNGISGGLSYLTVKDIETLRARYRKRVSKVIDEAVRRWPPELFGNDVERAVNDIMKEYTLEVSEYLETQRHRRIPPQLMKLTINLLALVVAPFGIWSVGDQARDWYKRTRELPLQWFLAETRARVGRRRA